MKTYIALFRGINVGGENILTMKDLKCLLSELGCENVKTYIQSGNVVFLHEDSHRGDLSVKISQKIQDQFGFEPKVMLLEPSDLEKAIRNNPFPTDNGKALHFNFLETIPENPDLNTLTQLKSETEDFKLIYKLFYLYAPDGIGRSKLAAKVEKCLGVSGTGRNWNTVKKLKEMIEK